MPSPKKKHVEWVFPSGAKITWTPGENEYRSADPKGEVIRHFHLMTIDPDAEVTVWRQDWDTLWDIEDMDDG